jgi:uracil-DNA glycosylase
MNDILEALRSFRAPNVFNPWADVDPLDRPGGTAMRCEQLRRHFDVIPLFLLIGEAPGYKGCHFSGVPFTDEAMLCAGAVSRIGKCGRVTRCEKPWAESSATVVWDALREAGVAERVVMWNAFAFHPYKPGEPLSNRVPTADELQKAMPFLRMVLDHFASAAVVAVGKLADKALRKVGRETTKVRHPSYGGAQKFRAGIMELMRASETEGGSYVGDIV